MSYFQILINDSLVEKAESSISEFHETSDTKITIFGHFCGIVIEGKVYEKKLAIEKIIKTIQSDNDKDINQLFRNIVGPCYFLVQQKNKIQVFASASSYGFLYGKIGNQYYISNYEGLFYKEFTKINKGSELNDMMLLNAVVSHHSVIRAPFEGLVKKTNSCPPGCKIKIEQTNSILDCFIMQDSSEIEENQIEDKNLQDIFKNVSYLISKSLNNKVDNFKIAFSGGIDSSLLLSLFNKEINNQNSLFYKNYGTKQERQLALNISNSLGHNLEVVESKEGIDIDFIIKKGKSGLGTILAEDYLKLGGKSSPFSQSITDTEKFSITGQNADTLFHIDHFGPDNREMGLAKFLYVIFFMHKRIYYSMPYYKEKWWLRLFPFSVPRDRFNKTIYSLLKSTFSGVDEHVGPYEEDTIKTPDLIDRDKFQNFRKNIFFDPLVDICKKKYSIDIENNKINEINPNLVNHIVRSSRWFRSITNFAQQFGNMSYYENYNVIMFFSEGPISSQLLNYKLRLKQNFIIKDFILRTFKKFSGSSYNRYRLRTFYKSNYISYFINNLLRVIEIFVRRKFRKFSFKSSKYIDEDQNKSQKFSLSKVLKEILSKNNEINDILTDVVKDELVANYFKNCYKEIYSKDIDNISKEKKMELCRFVNLHLLISEMKEIY